jgi:alkanesulfonate monooxygenase SsuD/methylene tetrahydromethanopterin reductase-like flavin-dependent oxidoreductase (luciferase family)
VHDIVNLEAAGIPGVFVASNEFVDAAGAQARSLGADPAVVFVQHPIQDRTDDEMRALADGAVEALLGRLAAGSEHPGSEPAGGGT